MKEIFLTLSIIVGCISPFIGISTVVWGDFRPQRMTRLLIFLLSILFVGTLLAQGDRNGIYIASAQLFGSLVILLLSIKKGIGGWGTLDKVVLGLTFLSLTIWKLTTNAVLGLIMSIITDFIGFVPTIAKTWKYPETEEWRFYMSDVVSSSLSLLSLRQYTLGATAFPAYILFINTLGVILILGRRWALRPKQV